MAFVAGLAGCSSSKKASDEPDVAGAPAGVPVAAAARAAAEEEEVDVPLDQVPQNIKDAALAAVPGIVFTSAERETENGVVTYDLEGSLNGVAHEVEVTAAGVVVEIETGDDDDDDGDDDDGDDDDDR